MAKNRKGAQKLIIDNLRIAYPKASWVDKLEAKLKAKSDKEFDKWIRNGTIHIQVPNGFEEVVKIENIFKAAKEIDLEFWHRIKTEDPNTGTIAESPKYFLVCDPVIKRLKQTTDKANSIATTTGVIDQRTGQVTGASRASKISIQEVQLLHGQGRDYAAMEFLKTRGGDLEAQKVFTQSLMEQGTVSQEFINSLGTVTKSVQTTDVYLSAMHFDNNYMG